MPPKSKRQCIVDTLDDLTDEEFEKFIRQLLDRKEEPRVRRAMVQGKSRLQVADVLVSTFTEDDAVNKTVEFLKGAGCHEAAKELEQETKALLDKGGKRKTKPSSAKAEPSPTKESLNTIKFGKHKGKTFEWLLKNEVGYIAYIVASHQKELEGATGSQTNQFMANKAALTEYISDYPEVLEEVRFHCAYEKSKEAALKPGQKGKVLVGFGIYRWETLEDLYESNDQEKIKAKAAAILRKIDATAKPLAKK